MFYSFKDVRKCCGNPKKRSKKNLFFYFLKRILKCFIHLKMAETAAASQKSVRRKFYFLFFKTNF